MVLIYYAFQWFTGGGKAKTPAKPTAPAYDPETGRVITPPAGAARPAVYAPVWSQLNVPTDLYVYLSEDEEFYSFADANKLIWKEKGIIYGNLSETRYKEVQIDVPLSVQNNGSLYAHMYLTQRGRSPNPVAKSYYEEGTLYCKKLLTRYRKKIKEIAKKKLIDTSKKTEEGPAEVLDEEAEDGDEPWVSYWWNNVTISVMGDATQVPSNTHPSAMQNIRIHPDGQRYYPFFEVDDFWLLTDNLQPINSTVKKLNLSLAFTEKSFWYYQTLKIVDDNFKVQASMLGQDTREHEQMKRMVLETNPILLIITMVVSTLHSVFDFLAFKNDIQFWQGKKDMDGMSFRTIVMNVAFQLVIFLYLLDNETSWMIVISNGIGLAIEAWKIQKTVIVKPKQSFPFIEFIDKYKPSKLARKTQKYDQMAFQYLAYALYPLLFGYTIYSLMYEEHKSWYSFVVGTLVGFVYMFGFISMTPQLFINYKLKSVAHMPWKTFMYKALNTVIDDLFAFVIKMPWLHRLACFRDDLIFVIYLYQRWIYPEDKRRRNEFGQVGEVGPDDEDDDDDSDDEEVKKKREEKKAKKDVEDKNAKVAGEQAKSEGEKDGLRKRVTGAKSAEAQQ
ncbi:cleft lip and palate transmembrane protein 1-domain-containing protein [Zopfochytrium polystomum]|nr:cleft lip and palate transmembrane protein 1-domain-containing protein [Zopfochytrium polystomum]